MGSLARRQLVLGAATCAGVLQCVQVHAQQISQVDETATLAEVIVTAEKREQRLVDVPSAITTLGEEQLGREFVSSIADFARQVPGLVTQESGQGNTQLTIRGIAPGGLSFGTGNTPTVGIYLDDIPLNSSTALGLGDSITPDLDPSDLQRIEVLKGPQGTLYGAGVLGGLVKYVTKAPDLETFSGRVEANGAAVLGHGKGGGARGAINIPLVSERLGVRASAFFREDPGYVDDLQKGQEDTNVAHVSGGHLSASWQPADAFSLKLSALLQRRHSEDYSRVTYIAGTRTPLYGDLTHATLPTTGDNEQEYQAFGATAKLTLGSVALSSTTAYGYNKYDTALDFSPVIGPLFRRIYGVPNLSTILLAHFTTRKLTEELRLTNTTPQALEYQVGYFYTREDNTYIESIPAVDTSTLAPLDVPNIFATSGPSQYRENAGFGTLTYHMTDRIDLQGGLRYGRNEQYATSEQSGFLAQPNSPPVNSSESVTTYSITPSIKITPDVLAYLRFATGYRPGGPNQSVAGIPPTFESDETRNYEIGFKGELFGGRLFVDVDAYYIDWRNTQLKGTNAEQFSYFANIGSAVSKGLEFSSVAKLAEDLTSRLSLTYTDARLTTDAPADLGIYALDGDRMPYSPKLAGSLGLDYDFELQGDFLAFIGGDYSYVGERLVNFTSSASSPRARLPSYSMVNLRAGVSRLNYSASLVLRNATNGRGFVGGATAAVGRTDVVLTQPRTLMLSLSMSF